MRKAIWVTLAISSIAALWAASASPDEMELVAMLLREHTVYHVNDATEYHFLVPCQLVDLPGTIAQDPNEPSGIRAITPKPTAPNHWVINLPSGRQAFVHDYTDSNLTDKSECIVLITGHDHPWYQLAWMRLAGWMHA